jgi:hypothetical protein
MCEAYLFAMLENHDANRDSELAPFRKACAGQSKNMLEQLDALK